MRYRDIEVRLAFDPDASEVLNPIVDDPIAFSLWVLWKRKHIVSTAFTGDVKMIAEMVRLRKPKTTQSLIECFPRVSLEFAEADVKEFVTEWMEVLNGDARLFLNVGGAVRQLAMEGGE